MMARYVIRHSEQPTIWDAAAASPARSTSGRAASPPTPVGRRCWGVPAGVGVKPYVRDVEDALLVLEGSLTVGWQETRPRRWKPNSDRATWC